MTKTKTPVVVPEELLDDELFDLQQKLAAEAIRRRGDSAGITMDAVEEAADEDHIVSRGAIERFLTGIGDMGTEVPCPKCGKPVGVHARGRSKTFGTIKGKVELQRNYHYCRRCRHGFYPLDRKLDLPDEGKATEALQQRVLDLGITDSFDAAAERWFVHYPFSISENMVRLVVDRVGIELESSDDDYLQHALREPSSTQSDLGIVQSDGSMVPTREDGWREVKVGMVFCAENHLSNQQAKRGQISQARYVAVLGGQEEFKKQLDSAIRAECRKLPTTMLWMGDGALGNWKLAKELVPTHRVDILDWKHALDHSNDCAKALLVETPCLTNDWQRSVARLLRHHEPGDVIAQLLDCIEFAQTPDELTALNDLIRYYRNNECRMRYAHFIKLGYPISTGPVENAHKHVIQKRMKMAGQRWSVPRAQRMAALRAAYATTGPQRFHRSIRLAAAATRRSPKEPWHVERKASNR